jgi:GxxExxY protein
MPDPITEQIIAAAIEVHRHLSPALLESTYEEALCHEFVLRGISFERQKEVDVREPLGTELLYCLKSVTDRYC